VYAAKGTNFAKTMLKLACARDTLSVIDDQHGAPTSAELVADCTAHALRSALATPALAGLYHCAAAGETSWHGYAQHVLARAACAGLAPQSTCRPGARNPQFQLPERGHAPAELAPGQHQAANHFRSGNACVAVWSEPHACRESPPA